MNIVVCTNDSAQFAALRGQKQEAKTLFFDSGYAAEFYVVEIAKGMCDIFVCDLDIADTNALELAKRLKNYFPHIKLIFVSSNAHDCQTIFEAEPVYFLLKPLCDKLLHAAIGKAQGLIARDATQFLLIDSKFGIAKVPFREILYIESKSRLARVHEYACVREYYKKLDDIVSKLPASFVRCHKSFVVNMDKIKMLKNSAFVLYNNAVVPISQSHYSKVKQAFLSFTKQV